MSQAQSWWKGAGNVEQSQSNQPSFSSKPMEIPEETEEERLLTRRIHILGMGSIGNLIAHSLRCLPNPPPVTLMLHKKAMYNQFKGEGRIIRLINKETETNDERTGFDVDLLTVESESKTNDWKFIPHISRQSGEMETPAMDAEKMDTGELFISCLIVTVKANATVTALQSVKHRVNSKTTICFVQNGLGQIDELNQQVFTDPNTRPTYMLGIISHGVHKSGTVFSINHAGFGTVALGIYRDPDKYPLPPKSILNKISELSEDQRKQMFPTDEELYSNVSSRYLLRTLTRSPVLACAAFPYLDLFQLQLEKLVSNALLNPVTALLDVRNGEILFSDNLSSAFRLLLAEINMVIRGLPEFEGVPGIGVRFSPQRLETVFRGVAAKTAANSSSMREDIRGFKETEIEYINGYIVKRGDEQGIKCVLNYMIMQLVKGKSWIQRRSEGEYMPYGVTRVQSEVHDHGTGQPSVTLDDR